MFSLHSVLIPPSFHCLRSGLFRRILSTQICVKNLIPKPPVHIGMKTSKTFRKFYITFTVLPISRNLIIRLSFILVLNDQLKIQYLILKRRTMLTFFLQSGNYTQLAWNKIWKIKTLIGKEYEHHGHENTARFSTEIVRSTRTFPMNWAHFFLRCSASPMKSLVTGVVLQQTLYPSVFRSWLNFGHQLNSAHLVKKFSAPAPAPWSWLKTSSSSTAPASAPAKKAQKLRFQLRLSPTLIFLLFNKAVTFR